MHDVVIAGAGPAGSVAALLLARQGARVLLIDRARFPRDKLCGDTINPGVIRLLQRLGLPAWLEETGVPLDGMILTGDRGVTVTGRYPSGCRGRALSRRLLDEWLLRQAVRAGAELDEGTLVRGALVTYGQGKSGPVVAGLLVSGRDGGQLPVPARVTIAADGRRSRLAAELKLASYPRWPRRWAAGVYFEGVEGLGSFGEMHVRTGQYIGVAPLPGGLANVCLVMQLDGRREDFRQPGTLLMESIRAVPALAGRFAAARMLAEPTVLGPLAVDARGAGVPGMLLAGDAAGFIDPMTGDGLRFAMKGAELAADVALHALQHGTGSAHRTLAARRRRAFSGKWRFNRTLRRIVGTPSAVRAATVAASWAPWAIRRLVAIAGDVSD